MRDVVYYFDKLSPYARHELGEIQTNFNMSFTIDGSKDSTKLVVRSFSGQEVEPYTILKHEKTNTWWVAINDKVQRYANESGFVYVHTIQCNGAKELLNARDLTDCGFNSNKYVIGDVIPRLISLSKWDFPNVSVIYGDNINEVEVIPFVKTYENYTLLSAIREFLDAYNCDFKLTFDQYANGRLYNAYITIIPKTGNVDLEILDEDEFKDVREIKKIDKNNFGTTVVSNAENVISSEVKTYPSQGSVRLSSTQYEITSDNAVLRLPSPAYKVNWVRQKFPLFITFTDNDDTNFGSDFYRFDNQNSINTFIQNARTSIATHRPEALDDFNSQVDTIVENLKLASSITFYEGNSINPVDGTIVKGANVPYIPTIYKYSMWQDAKQVILADKSFGSCMPYDGQAIMWERGSDLITNFKYFNTNEGALYKPELNSFNDTDLQGGTNEIFFRYPSTGTYTFAIVVKLSSQNIRLEKSSFIVNYIPMSDLKIEIDNQRSTRDMQLYNQNGKLTDSVALSKILSSYSREISSDKITKYMTYYDFSKIPQAGQMVNINNELYVINNVSIDFFANENDSYYIPCEFNLCKYTSTKSLMVNPNTNIRDYVIPQNYNVKRKQLYRDYIEFSYTKDPNAEETFYSSNIPLSFNTFGYTLKTHCVSIRCQYSTQIGSPSSYYWYYQLDTTLYRLDKMHIELVDFKDNNIIGYGNQNIHSAFQVSRIFSGLLDTINTPISYVDDNGEVKGINLCFVTNEQLTNAWNDYQVAQGYSGNTDYDLSNFSCFIPQDVYDYLTSDNDIQIIENEYNKDPTEVPVFEYVFQVGDSDDVLIGDKILENFKNTDFPTHNIMWFYGFVQGDAGTLNQINALINAKSVVGGFLEDMVIIDDLYDDELYLQFANTQITPTANKDYAIYRIEYDFNTSSELQKQLVMVLKNVPSSAIIDGEIRLYKNKYKLK